MPVMMAMTVMIAAQQPRARDVHHQPEHGDRNRFAEVNRHGRQHPADRLVRDQQRDHREHDRAREAGEIAELAGAEHESRVARMLARIEYAKAAISIAPACVDMCSPSATSASEPKIDPPTISATIIAAHSTMTVQVLRSFCSCAAPRKCDRALPRRPHR
jgi:hypothetical protein